MLGRSWTFVLAGSQNGDKGVKGSTLPGLVLLAQVECQQVMYGVDTGKGHTLLRGCVEAIRKFGLYA